MYLHFTRERDAHQIVAEKQLGLSRTIVNAVYAVAVGSMRVPHVQHACKPTRARDAAVLFTTDEPPHLHAPEEVVWHRRTALPLHNPEVLTAAAADKLLRDDAEDFTPWADTRVCPPGGCAVWRASTAT